MLSWFGSLMGVVSPSTEVAHDLWSAWDRPGGQSPRSSCGSALDPRFRVGWNSAEKVQTGTRCRSDRAETARTADESWKWRRWEWRDVACALQTPWATRVSDVCTSRKKLCQKNVRATRSVCTVRNRSLFLAHPTDGDRCSASKNTQASTWVWFFESSKSPAKSESWNKPSLQCCAVFPTWQYCRKSFCVMHLGNQPS